MKSYTDLEQSKKLAEILPLESADICYIKHSSSDNPTWEFKEDIPPMILGRTSIEDMTVEVLPCWSLSALLSVLPQSITKYIVSEKCQKTFHLNLFRSYYHCCSYSFAPSISDDDGSNTLYCVGRNNWVDACVAMIEKLHELKML